jgi:hypothetical protein
VRYNEFSWINLGFFDLHKLDTLVSWLRSLSVPLDGRLLEDTSQDGCLDPALFELQKSIGRYPILAEANFAFVPNLNDNPSCERTSIARH